MEIRRIRSTDWRLLREIRLRALATDPQAFGSSLREEKGKPEQWWVAWAEEDAVADHAITLLALDAEHPVGLIGAFRVDADPTIGRVVAAWVDSQYRQQGIASALLDAVTSWAIEGGLVRLRVWVTDANSAAQSLYGKAGFVPTGDRKPLPSDPDVQELEMERILKDR